MGVAEACIPDVHKTLVGIQALLWAQQHPKGGKDVGTALSGPGYIDITQERKSLQLLQPIFSF